MVNQCTYQTFTQPLLAWYSNHGRKDLPWQHPQTPYRVWVSEIMLQQTQVKTVIPYFNRFMESFPDIQTLANADEDDVLSHWSSLGYYSRARNLHHTAKIIHYDHQDKFPATIQQLLNLKGIGPSTAAAIASLAFNQPTAILDGNVKRVLCRYFMVEGSTKKAHVQKKLTSYANQCMPESNCREYTQAIMDLGATCCTPKKPACSACPLQNACLAYQHNAVEHFPNKDEKKTLPTKQQHFLLLYQDDGTILLEKRPPKGIWGGLWCLPAIDITLNPISHLTEHYGFAPKSATEFMTLKHSFTHLHLSISVWSFEVCAPLETIDGAKQAWFTFSKTKTLGLARPVSLILEKFNYRQPPI